MNYERIEVFLCLFHSKSAVTNAQRGAKLLRNRGYKPIIHRIENPQPTDGCGYVIKLETGDEEKIYKILSQAGISVTGVERE